MPHPFETLLGYHFTASELLEKALTHPSAYNIKHVSDHYERLEFLGDAVLDMIVAELLYQQFPEEVEGDLAKRRSALVCGETLSAIARELGVAEYIVMGAGEEGSGGRDNNTTLENVLEALVAALYLDGGLPAAKAFVERWFAPYVEKAVAPPKDPKTTLQEWAQAQGKEVPCYETIEQEGPSHQPVFTVQVTIEGGYSAQGVGSSKKLAEREAAKTLLSEVGVEYDG